MSLKCYKCLKDPSDFYLYLQLDTSRWYCVTCRRWIMVNCPFASDNWIGCYTAPSPWSTMQDYQNYKESRKSYVYRRDELTKYEEKNLTNGQHPGDRN